MFQLLNSFQICLTKIFGLAIPLGGSVVPASVVLYTTASVVGLSSSTPGGITVTMVTIFIYNAQNGDLGNWPSISQINNKKHFDQVTWKIILTISQSRQNYTVGCTSLIISMPVFLFFTLKLSYQGK